MPKRVSFLILLLVVIFYASFKPVNASISACSVNSVSPQSLTAGNSSTIVFNITNNDESSNLLHWIKFSAPNNFSITSLDGPNSGGSTINESGTEAIITTTLSSGESGDFSVGVNTTGGVTSSSSFTIQASDSSDGDSSVSCSGDLTISLVSGGSSAISVSNLSLSVNDSGATISWSTSIPTTGSVQYGTSTAYDSTVSDTNLGTSHSITLSSLSASTVYHYLITSTDQSNNTAGLSDKTFTTSPSGETKTVTTTVTSTITNSVREVYKDVILPSIKIKSELKKIYDKFPAIEFSATDESGIARIRYSLDDGHNWLPVNIDDKIGKKQIASSFTPSVTDDGEYSLIIEVTDAAGNKNLSKSLKLTIDRLPPAVGPLVVMSGPQIINVDSNNNMELLIDVEYKFILTSAGGPKTINITCGDKKYDFEKNIDTGVWVSKIRFNETTDTCEPLVTAVDGAGNIQEKKINKIVINKRGILKNGTITVYWYDNFENKFVVWDASPYGQNNPISTSITGGYSFLLPQGKYYIEAKSAGKRTTVSNIIDIKGAAIINDDWLLKPVWKFWQLSEEKKISPKILGSNDWEKQSISLPNINLFGLNNKSFSTLDVRGSVSVVGLFTSWHPFANEYLKVFDSLNSNNIKSYPILLQEKSASANFLKNRGGYNINIYADPDGEFLKELDVSGLPATLIINKFGQIVYQKFGSMSYQEVIDVISKID